MNFFGSAPVEKGPSPLSIAKTETELYTDMFNRYFWNTNNRAAMDVTETLYVNDLCYTGCQVFASRNVLLNMGTES